MDTQEQPLEISAKWLSFCNAYIIFCQIIVLKGLKNKIKCITLLFDVEYWLQRLTAPLSYNIIRRQSPFLAISRKSRQPLLRSGQTSPFLDRVPLPGYKFDKQRMQHETNPYCHTLLTTGLLSISPPYSGANYLYDILVMSCSFPCSLHTCYQYVMKIILATNFVQKPTFIFPIISQHTTSQV